jgi:hypothetical protein
MRMCRYVFAVLLAFITSIINLSDLGAQALTGQISGEIQDPAGKLVPGAAVALLNAATGQKRSTVSNATGDFVFTQVLPGDFDLRVELAGFKKFEQKAIVLSAGQHLVLNPVNLELGHFDETVSVEATAAPLDTESSERSGLVDSHQLQELSLKGRDYLGTLKLLPPAPHARLPAIVRSSDCSSTEIARAR